MRRDKMKNDYEIRGDIVVIFLKRRSGETIETFIDLDDLPILLSIPVTWFAHKDNYTGKFYVRYTKRSHGKQKTILMHRVLTNAVDGQVVDHFDGNTLNNRTKTNIKAVSPSENHQNRKFYKNNTSGCTGINWIKSTERWRAALVLNGKPVTQKNFISYEEAVKYMNDIRKKHHVNFNESRKF